MFSKQFILGSYMSYVICYMLYVICYEGHKSAVFGDMPSVMTGDYISDLYEEAIRCSKYCPIQPEDKYK